MNNNVRITIKLMAVLCLFGFGGCAEMKPLPDSIGGAKMLPDGTITLWLRATNGAAVGDAFFEYKPGDPDYEKIRAHLGGIKPGEDKPVPPWTD